MKNRTLNNTFVTLLLVGALGYGGIVAAHDINGALGAAAGATDYYQVTCFDDNSGPADHLIVKIKDLAPVAVPIISVQVTKQVGKTFIARNSTDAVDGNATYSPELNIKGGNGTYFLAVDKTSANAETYNVQIHCETSTGLHTGTQEPVLLQNQ